MYKKSQVLSEWLRVFGSIVFALVVLYGVGERDRYLHNPKESFENVPESVANNQAENIAQETSTSVSERVPASLQMIESIESKYKIKLRSAEKRFVVESDSSTLVSELAKDSSFAKDFSKVFGFDHPEQLAASPTEQLSAAGRVTSYAQTIEGVGVEGASLQLLQSESGSGEYIIISSTLKPGMAGVHQAPTVSAAEAATLALKNVYDFMKTDLNTASPKFSPVAHMLLRPTKENGKAVLTWKVPVMLSQAGFIGVFNVFVNAQDASIDRVLVPFD
jgi:Zn-dependent metalloprotease